MDDPRFQKFLNDPRSRNIPRNVRKIKIDKRFKNMFDAKGFKEGGKLDERGRKLEFTSAENLKKLYNVTSESSEDDEEGTFDIASEENVNLEKSEKITGKGSLKTKNFKSKPTKKDQTENELVTDKQKQKSKLLEESEEDSAAEESESSDSISKDDSESEEDSDSESDEDSDSDEKEFDHHWEELDQEAPETEEITRRLALCNMDWDRIRADDLFIVFNSFKPPDSLVYSVKIYPSEFGLKRMEDEKLNGPSELIEEKLDPEEEETGDTKISKYHREKLRQYQLNRLKYYYAVIECDTPQTANALYEALNGMEYESSSVRFDLRFIPDNVTFDQEASSVSEKLPERSEYKPRLFVTSALQQVKVNLTWDETDPKRKETLQKAFTEPESLEKDIKSYLASSSGESEDEVGEEQKDEANAKIPTKEMIAKYKALLHSLEENVKKDEEKYEMEITWEPGLKEKTEKMVKEKQEETENPFEEILKKKKDRRLKKKVEKSIAKKKAIDSESSASDVESNSSIKDLDQKGSKKFDELYLLSDTRKAPEQHKKSKKQKRKNTKMEKEKQNDFKCDVKDPRFSAIYTSHEYNLDPSDPHFKQTEGSLAIIQEKQNRLKNKEQSFSNYKKSKKFKYK